MLRTASTAGISLIVASAGYAGAYYSANKAVEAAIHAEHLRQNAELGKETREKRAEVYAVFLQVVDIYSTALIGGNEEMLMQTTAGGASGTSAPYLGVKSETQLKQAENQVYIYGSDDAWINADRLYSFLIAEKDAIVVSGGQEVFDVDEYLLLYKRFRSVFCAEASSLPRSTC
ncbi:hypothetical protein [Rhodococcus aetherivorans]|uniref:hypothetical protein n=1 Tax=Rhodococcus aetherivorans TaxID=191292 RepID=UPI001E41CDE2|nr:hypothetical protein [Rhodococcus aetherivorans]UGQ39391.1 hypothetical protein LRQ66_14335 [Rhodococcus aetherivorans]